MLARDVMTKDVISVRPDTGLRDIARLLIEKGISAVPVIDESGAPLGMVSEGDLIGRDKAAREVRRDWWLAMLAEGEELNADYLASLRPANATAAKVMSAPLVTVTETTDLAEVARLLEAYHIKRVPVLRDNRIVGIVSRADLVRVLAATTPAQPEAERHPAAHRLYAAIATLEDHLEDRIRLARATSPEAQPPAAQATPSGESPTAESFRERVAKSHEAERRQQERARSAAAEHRKEQVQELTEHHIDDAAWHALLTRASEAAQHGDKEFLLLRFPNALCSDGGRAINAPTDDWPQTLRGEAAEIYRRWEQDLRPRGFHLSARVLEFPGGFPGDIGLFLTWET